ncbi:MAG: 3'-5' exonuclease [Rickettsiales bacterium]|nr:3'-5' exonuclease [Rickettsiales bacterium]
MHISKQKVESLSFEQIANILNNSKDYRVLKRFTPIETYNVDTTQDKLIGVFVDVETTGLSCTDKIIELALVPFEFTGDGRIFRVLENYCTFQDPNMQISEQVTSLTGITNEMVSGCSIDADKVEHMIDQASLIIAHNARFDRQFLERQFPIFAKKPWACTLTQIPWHKEDISSAKLEFLAYTFNFFYEAHRATMDCLVGIHILTQMLPVSGQVVFEVLLDVARSTSFRIIAESAPYDCKDILKARGYRWHDGSNNRPRAWFIEVAEQFKDEELNFLYSQIYKYKPVLRVEKITPYNRFSIR